MSTEQQTLEELAKRAGIVLLYHGTFSSPPVALAKGLHNVTPELLFRQLETLSRYFRFLPLDEYCMALDRTGLAAVTADDGYRCITDEALGVFEALQIPLTIFVNRAFMDGGIFWRDKIRFIINTNRVAEFEHRYSDKFFHDPDQPFYRYTKDPRNNSRVVESALDDFLTEIELPADLQRIYTPTSAGLLAHPLLSYGSHSLNHYVMASLNEADQWREIDENWRFLNNLPEIQKTSIFSVPFGGNGDYNAETIRLAMNAGHSGLLLSEGVVEPGAHSGFEVLPTYQRVMLRGDEMATTLLRADKRGRQTESSD